MSDPQDQFTTCSAKKVAQHLRDADRQLHAYQGLQVTMRQIRRAVGAGDNATDNDVVRQVRHLVNNAQSGLTTEDYMRMKNGYKSILEALDPQGNSPVYTAMDPVTEAHFIANRATARIKDEMDIRKNVADMAIDMGLPETTPPKKVADGVHRLTRSAYGLGDRMGMQEIRRFIQVPGDMPAEKVVDQVKSGLKTKNEFLHEGTQVRKALGISPIASCAYTVDAVQNMVGHKDWWFEEAQRLQRVYTATIRPIEEAGLSGVNTKELAHTVGNTLDLLGLSRKGGAYQLGTAVQRLQEKLDYWYRQPMQLTQERNDLRERVRELEGQLAERNEDITSFWRTNPEFLGRQITSGLVDVVFERRQQNFSEAHDDAMSFGEWFSVFCRYFGRFRDLAAGVKRTDRNTRKEIRKALVKAVSVGLAAIESIDRAEQAERVHRTNTKGRP